MKSQNRCSWIGFVALSGLFLGACGREVPEGYAPVSLKLGETARGFSLADAFLRPADFATFSVCKPDRLDIVVLGPGIEPPIRMPLEVEFDDPRYDPVFPEIGAKILVPKGDNRLFVVSGIWSGAPCALTELYRHPIAGVLPLRSLVGPVALDLPAAVYGEPGFRIEANTSFPLALEGGPFVDLKIVFSVNTTQTLTVKVLNESDHFIMGSAEVGVSGGETVLRVGPLIPFKNYVIDLINANNEVIRRFGYFVSDPAKKEQVLNAVPAASGAITSSRSSCIP